MRPEKDAGIETVPVEAELSLSARAIQAAEQAGLLLLRDEKGLYLTDGKLQVRGDFTQLLPRLRPGNLNGELIVKAARTKRATQVRPLAIDATAGLGEDSLLLAAAGFRVILYENDPVIAALLRDALRRATDDPDLTAVVSRMELREEDSIAALKRDHREQEVPEAIFLDPMFPERQKSALVKKKFQLLQRLESPCTDEEALLAAALTAGPRKILVKRPLKGPWLAGMKPAYSLSGKAVRIDVLLPASMRG
ncbi:MAG: class I SAM-dependent methyltransferase [Clostridia bacterium]|nr:class I SAM-dependent methyltransferase [Clostridia bacterium]